MIRLTRISATALFLSLSACVQPAANGPASGDSVPPSAGSQESDWAAILRLEVEAKAIAKTSGCSSAAQCRAAPVGNRACGGPRHYIPYCSTSTDSVALFRKLDEIIASENEYNRKYELMSTCEFRMPPELQLLGGVCASR